MDIAIITASDKGSRGEREDVSADVIREIVISRNHNVVKYSLLPDDRAMLSAEMLLICDENIADLILTTGGTGFSIRDITPEATLDIIERRADGIVEAMRASSMLITKRSMLSRAVAGIRNRTLIINLPGSPKAVRENLEFIIDDLEHGIDILKGSSTDCGTEYA